MTRNLKKLLLMLLTMMMVLCMGTVSNAASIKLNKKKVTLYVTQTTTLKVTGTTKKVKWSSSDKKIAKVSKKGKVTAVKAGKATITARVGKKSLKCTVTVKKGLNKKSVTLEAGKTEKLKLYGTKIKSVKTSKKSVATISKSGKITAKKAGKCTVTITGKDGKKYTCKVTVVKPKAVETEVPQTEAQQTEAQQTEAPQTEASQTEAAQTEAQQTEASQTEAAKLVTALMLNQTSAELAVGGTIKLTVTAAPADAANQEVKWSSSNTAVAVVDDSGTVTGMAAGTAEIRAAALDGSNVNAVCTVVVLADEDEIIINGVTGAGVQAYRVVNSINTLTLYGTVDSVDIDSLTVAADENMTVTVKKNTDSASKVIGYVLLTTNDNQDYEYKIYYVKLQTMETDETYTVLLDMDDTSEHFLVTPTKSGTYKFAISGTYDDMYMELRDSGGNLLIWEHCGDIDKGVIAFEYDLSAGRTYYFSVNTGDGESVSGEVVMTYVDEAVSATVAATQELAVSAELYIDLFAEETSVLDEVEISEAQEIVETSDTTETLNAAGTEAQEDELDIMEED